MDDLSEKLSALLSDEETVNQLKTLAESLGLDPSSLGSSQKEDAHSSARGEKKKSSSSFSLDPSLLQKLAGALRSEKDDEDAALLRALKPHLSEERHKRVDDAVRMLRLLNLLPLVKDLGLFGGDDDG